MRRSIGSILTLVATKQQLLQTSALLTAYAFGAGLPMLAIAYGGQAAIQRVRFLSRYTNQLQRCFGLIILLVAVAIYFGLERDAQTWLVLRAPWLFPNLKLNLDTPAEGGGLVSWVASKAIASITSLDN